MRHDASLITLNITFAASHRFLCILARFILLGIYLFNGLICTTFFIINFLYY